MRWHGGPVARPTRGAAQAAGIVHLPGDRHREGVFLLALGAREHRRCLALARRARRASSQPRPRGAGGRARRSSGSRSRRPPSRRRSSSLSGGNQQKVLFARSLLAAPGGAARRRADPWRRRRRPHRALPLLRDAADSGKAVVVLSSDAVELQGLCDRVLVFSRGEVVGSSTASDHRGEHHRRRDHVRGPAADPSWPRARGGASGSGGSLAGDYLPSAVLVLLILALGAYTGASNGRFFSGFNFRRHAAARERARLRQPRPADRPAARRHRPLGRPAHGARRRRLLVLRRAGPERRAGSRSACWPCSGPHSPSASTNGLLVRAFRLAPVLATLATSIVIQGISLLLRPQPGASSARASPRRSRRASAGSRSRSSPLPSSRSSCELRAAAVARGARAARGRLGRDARAPARRAGRLRRICRRLRRCARCSRPPAGIMLAAQGVGMGDPRSAVNYTLTSITAVVLGGASIFGGRGSFFGALPRRGADPGDHHRKRFLQQRTYPFSDVPSVACAVLAARHPDPRRRRASTRAPAAFASATLEADTS